MVQADPYKDRIANICREWDRAEEDIKLAEQVCHKVVWPAIKELRYAGRRIVEALNEIQKDSDPKDIEKLFQDAEFDCHRARHDAIDAATAKIAIDLENAEKKLGFSPILKCLPEYSKLRRKLNAIRRKIGESRGDRSNREGIYSRIEANEFREIVAFFNEFQENEHIMKRLARRERLIMVLSIGAFVIAIFGIILTVALSP